MKFSIICPTRKRPLSIVRLLKSLRDTSDDLANVEVLFYVDLDDTITQGAIPNILSTNKDISTKWIIGPRILLCQMSNELSKLASGEILFLCGDDVVFETKGWDFEVTKEFEKVKDKVLLVYGKDGIQNEKLATHFFVHRVWLETLGYIVPPLFGGDYADNWAMSVAINLNRLVYKENLRLTHYHVIAGLAPMDETYHEKYERDRKINAPAILRTNLPTLKENISKLQRIINETA